MFVLVCYDVPAHRTQVYKKSIQRFLERGQASVFWGDLPPSMWLELEKELVGKFEEGDNVWAFTSENPHNLQEWLLETDARNHPRFKKKGSFDKRSTVV